MIPTCKDINCPQVLFYNIHTFGLKLIHMTYCEVELKLIMENAQYFLDVCHAFFTFDQNIKNTEHAEDKFDFNQNEKHTAREILNWKI